MNSVFSEQILADKLSKLNSTQQCIETLSHWCIFHRKNAEQVVQTWDKQFHSSQKEQKIPFLYLANDILQNSKRTGSEFVGEFWKVLPGAVKDVNENGDDYGKNVVSRLVTIWEERRVFGSRARGLKDLMLSSEPLPDLELNRKRSRTGSVKIMRRDSRSIKLKLSIGGTAEKIVSALHTVLSEHHSEDTDLNKCKDTVRRLEKMEKDVESACVQVGDPRRATLTEEIQEEETTLKLCIEKIKLIEANRDALVSQLKETLQEQESQLESVRTQLQVAQGQAEQAANMRRRLNNEPIVPPLTSAPPPKPISNGPTPSSTDTSKKTAAAIAAEVADRLAASTHSQQIMTSVLSTFAAEEAKNANLASSSNTNLQPKPVKPPETTTTFVPVQSMPQAVLVQQAPMQNQVATVAQPQYNIFATPGQQYLQPSGGMMIGLPYAYTAMPPPPPPPPPPQMMNLARPPPLAQQQPTMIQQPAPPQPPPHMQQPMVMHQPMHRTQQPAQFGIQLPGPPSYRPLQAPGMGFYHQQTQ
ncbi:regulation of nuclear pre-mRNA domain-containing protein 1B [Iris pallida]|uniref:Regulation of nuclear pre-mRNA domain-containing protein 1B n=1 Tax=Iris pallida TaxID=29817 RepID=A0AAX6DIW0_IRIPA|nr:regulation of nuclear pre-mRNA domain-containing protein 1B [Iris pallida]